jgi:hypothetical protein
MAPVPDPTDLVVEADTDARGPGAAPPGRLLGGAVRPLDLDRFEDHRGSLTPMSLEELDFSVARVFVVNAPRGAVRGGHAHRSVRQVLFRAAGIIDVELRHQGESVLLTLDEERPAVLVEAGVWAQQTYLDEGSTLIVFADGGYDRREYLDHDRGADEDVS